MMMMTMMLMMCTGGYEKNAASCDVSTAGVDVRLSHHLSQRARGESRKATTNR